MKNRMIAIFCLVAVALLASSVWAAPALDIRTISNGGSVLPALAGPSGIDPNSDMGQWFQGRNNPDRQEVRTHEFHDNVEEHGGGFMDYLAIQGQAVNILDPAGADWKPGAQIGSFDILATITNDLPGNPDMAQWGSNSHDERVEQPVAIKEKVVMTDVKLTAEFAVDPQVGPPSLNTSYPPYRTKDKYIVAEDHDQLGWYCYADEVSPDLVGNFSVPTWDFGDIRPGDSAQRLMHFTVMDAGGAVSSITSSDPEYEIFIDPPEDLLLNRTTSLKISTWVDDLQGDWGAPYPEEPLRGSNCSVFFNPEPVPEPGALALLVGLGLAGVVLRRRGQ